MKNILLSSLVALLASLSLNAQVTISDPVDTDDGWTYITSGGFSPATFGLTPVEGDTFFFATTTSSQNRGAWKYFTDVEFIEGNYTATFSVGKLDARDFASGISFLLMADTNDDGNYQYSERILDSRVIVSDPTPASGEWETWTVTWTITGTTETEGSELVLGHDIGFYALASNLNGAGYAFDALDINSTAIPEPSAFAAMAGLLALCGVTLRRRLSRRA